MHFYLAAWDNVPDHRLFSAGLSSTSRWRLTVKLKLTALLVLLLVLLADLLWMDGWYHDSPFVSLWRLSRRVWSSVSMTYRDISLFRNASFSICCSAFISSASCRKNSAARFRCSDAKASSSTVAPTLRSSPELLALRWSYCVSAGGKFLRKARSCRLEA